MLPGIAPDLLAEISGELLAIGARIVGLKLGYRGFYLRTAGRRLWRRWAAPSQRTWRPGPNRECGRPVSRWMWSARPGSGDPTIAGFLAALLRDLAPEEAVNAAVAVGACNVEAADTSAASAPGMRRCVTWQPAGRGGSERHST